MVDTNKYLSQTTFSKRFKRKMNRVFREKVGTKNIPHPEVDTVWERLHSRIVCFFQTEG